MQPISQKAGISNARQASSPEKKTEPSKFDLLKADLNKQLTGTAQIPPKVSSISDQEKQLLENDLRRKLASGKSAEQIASGQVQQVGSQISNLNQQIGAVPNAANSPSIRDRLQSIEADFESSSKLLKNPGNLDDPKRLLQMQMEMYKVQQNVEILSRLVGDVSSGVKTIVQTQV
jgi:hypothetical protein